MLIGSSAVNRNALTLLVATGVNKSANDKRWRTVFTSNVSVDVDK
jgi:hypothetical protein